MSSALPEATAGGRVDEANLANAAAFGQLLGDRRPNRTGAENRNH